MYLLSSDLLFYNNSNNKPEEKCLLLIFSKQIGNKCFHLKKIRNMYTRGVISTKIYTLTLCGPYARDLIPIDQNIVNHILYF